MTGTRRLDLGILNRTGAYPKSVNVCLILTEGLRIEGKSLCTDALFMGYNNNFEIKDGFNLDVPEKPLLDTIYLCKRIPFEDELELENIDHTRLMSLAEAFPAAIRKRLAGMIK